MKGALLNEYVIDSLENSFYLISILKKHKKLTYILAKLSFWIKSMMF